MGSDCGGQVQDLHVQWIKQLPLQPLSSTTRKGGSVVLHTSLETANDSAWGSSAAFSSRTKQFPGKPQTVRVEKQMAHGKGSTLFLLC